MSGREVVEQWLFEYSCRHRLIHAIAEIAQKHHNVWSAENCAIPSIYVLLAYMREVIEELQVSQYEVVISELTRLYDVSSNYVPFNVYSRLVVALKALVLFEMLRKNDKLVLPRLNAYFPRSGFHHEKADKDFAEHLNAGQQQFRKIFLRLIVDKQERRQYFRDRYDMEYGIRFIDKMKQLSRRFIDALDESLPLCAIDRLLGKNADQELMTELSLACSPSFELLLDAVNDSDCLTESQVIDLLHNLRPCSDVAHTSFGQAIMPGIICMGDESCSNPAALQDSSSAPSLYSCTVPTVIVNRNLMHVSGPPAAKRPRISEVNIFCTNPQTDSSLRFFQQDVEPSRRCPSVDSLTDFDTRYSLPQKTNQCPVDRHSSRFCAEQITEDELCPQAHKTAVGSKLCGEGSSDSSSSSRQSGLVNERVSLHMTEFLKFIEKAETVDESMAQVDTVSSSVPDTDLSACGSTSCVSLSPLEGQRCVEKSRIETTGQRVVPDSPVLVYSASGKSPRGISQCNRISAEVVSSNNATLIGSEESFISDSDLQSRLDMRELHLVPSSYSFDQYDVMLSGMSGGVVPIPAIQNHLRPAAVQRSCVVKLYRNRELGCWC